ncbi:MAG TPA: hypothetical protein VMT61_01475 [Candidatus Binataceae bacterium]|nr:hypothetical protein [Candidatus Binataceae bacterium]
MVERDPSGSAIATYPFTGATVTLPIFAVNFDPDGKSFWTADLGTGDVFKIDIATGNAPV